MGYDQNERRRTYELNIRPYPGLTVRVRKPGFAALERLTSAVLVLGDDLEGAGLPAPDRLKAWGQLYRAFAASLVGWTLFDGVRPVPATAAGVLAQDPGFLLELARTWYHAVVLRPADVDNTAGPSTWDSNSAQQSQDHRPERVVSGANEADMPPEDDGEPRVDEEWLAQFPTIPVPAPADSDPPAEPEVAA